MQLPERALVKEYLGDPADYDYLMGVSGLAFRRLWNRDDGGNVGPFHFAPEALRRAFWALGYDYRIVSPKPRDWNDEAAMVSLGHELYHALGARH